MALWRARNELGAYGILAYALTPARHHVVWLDAIVRLVTGQAAKRRLLIIAPPGHAKSTWTSLIFPCWHLGNHPDETILFFTSSDTNAHQFGTTVRTTLEASDGHRAAFGTNRLCDPDPARGWSSDGLYLKGTPAGSKDPAYRAMGYGASVIGARAHGIILDDPMAQEQAQSLVEQEKAKRYHDMTVDSRLHPDGWEIAIMTRWHENDLASYLMSKPDWDVIQMPALGYWGAGKALWPERFPVDWLEAKRRDTGTAMFACLYQGDPTALGGLVFKSGAWFKPMPTNFDPRVLQLTIVQYWDLAYSAKQTADYTCAVTVGVDKAQNVYILDVFRTRLEEEQLDEAIALRWQVHRPAVVGIEKAAFKQKATGDLLVRLLRRRPLAAAIQAVEVDTDKVTRARLPASRAEAGLIYADRGASWWPEFEAEVLSFPLASHDDQVDALSGAVQLAVAVTAWPQREEPVPYEFGKLSSRTTSDQEWFQRRGWG